jgi:hypothetical protein
MKSTKKILKNIRPIDHVWDGNKAKNKYEKNFDKNFKIFWTNFFRKKGRGLATPTPANFF